MVLDRMQLQNICKKGDGSFKEHAQKVEDLAAQVVPPMMEAMMSMKKIMEADAVAIAATSTVVKVNLMPPSDLNQ